MSEQAQERPEFLWLQEYKKRYGRELLHRYGAHSVGIGWKKEGGKKTDRLALIFYVEKKLSAEDSAVEQIPSSVTFTPLSEEDPITLLTDVVESTPAQFE